MAEDTKTEMVLAEAAFKADWPKDNWSRFKPGDYVVERYTRIAQAVLAARPSADQAEGVGKPAAWQMHNPTDLTQLIVVPHDPRGVFSWAATPLYAPGTDPAIARLTEVLDQRNADIKRLSGQVGDVSREAQTLRTQTERQIREISGWVVKHEKAQQDIRKLENLLMNSAEFCVSETERADTAEAALRASNATQTDGGGK